MKQIPPELIQYDSFGCFEFTPEVDPSQTHHYSSAWSKCLGIPDVEAGVLYHRSNDGSITHFSPRQSPSSTEFASKKAVFATDLLPLAALYAVVLRAGLRTRVNGAFHEGDRLFYFYSISHALPIDQAVVPGFVYVLDRSEFIVDPGDRHHWASDHDVKLIERILITPSDIPFCPEIRTHDQKALLHRVESQGYDGFPFFKDHEIYPSDAQI